MTDHGYDARADDPYCYPGTRVLRNRAGLGSASRLEAFELEMTALRAEEELPNGRFGPAHFKAVHKHLFQDVYSWAGRYRTVRTAKGGNVFCYPENIAREMDQLFGRLRSSPFVKGAPVNDFVYAAASFLAELNAIHAFREGNGRAQLAFLYLVGIRADHPLDLTRIRPRAFLAAMIKSFRGANGDLVREVTPLCR